MFILKQIEEAHAKVKSGADFPKYIQAIKKLGVIGYKVYVVDNHTDYYGKDDFYIVGKPKYEDLHLSNVFDKAIFEQSLKDHQQGKSNYFEFCKKCAKTGVESWFVSLDTMTCTYFDVCGNNVLVEKISN